MGRDFAEAIPAAMDVFRRGSAATGLDLERLCFHADAEELVDTAVQQPALVATSLADARGAAGARRQGRLRHRPLGRRVRRAGGGRGDDGGRGDGARARARPGNGRGRGAQSRLDGGHPRPRRRGGGRPLPEDPRSLARELQLSRADRRLRASTPRSTSASSRRRTRAPAARSSSRSRARSIHRSSRAPPTGCGPRSRRSSSRSRRRRSCRR